MGRQRRHSQGSGNRLMPDADCTRAQLVTLLYRLESQTR